MVSKEVLAIQVYKGHQEHQDLKGSRETVVYRDHQVHPDPKAHQDPLGLLDQLVKPVTQDPRDVWDPKVTQDLVDLQDLLD